MRTALLLLALLAASGARAASVDMTTQTCQDYLDAGEDEQDQMIAWLRGYIAGRATSTLYDMSRARIDANALKLYCTDHKEIGVISAASQWR